MISALAQCPSPAEMKTFHSCRLKPNIQSVIRFVSKTRMVLRRGRPRGDKTIFSRHFPPRMRWILRAGAERGQRAALC